MVRFLRCKLSLKGVADKVIFTKMHGLGNDFLLFDGFQHTLPEYGPLAKVICDRHFGVGGDGIMVCLPSLCADVRMVYYNSDGSQGEMCGNGIRCFSKYIYEKNIIRKKEFNVETLAGYVQVILNMNEDGSIKFISVEMGKPILSAEFVPTTLAGNPVLLAPLDIDGLMINISAICLGVPHGVILCEDLDEVDINYLGAKIESHHAFPEKINANFMQIVNREQIIVKTYERGAGRTLACGTGCSSCVVVGNFLGLLESHVSVQTEGGFLEVTLSGENGVSLSGPAEMICDGVISPTLIKRINDITNTNQV